MVCLRSLADPDFLLGGSGVTAEVNVVGPGFVGFALGSGSSFGTVLVLATFAVSDDGSTARVGFGSDFDLCLEH